MTQEELSNLEKQVVLEGNEDAIKTLIEYYEKINNQEKANQYMKMLVDENAQNQTVPQQNKQKVTLEEQIDLAKLQEQYVMYTENQYDSLDYGSLKEEAENNPFAMIVFADKCKNMGAYDDATYYYNKSLDILSKTNLYHQIRYDTLCDLAEIYITLKESKKVFNTYSNAYEIKEEHTVNHPTPAQAGMGLPLNDSPD